MTALEKEVRESVRAMESPLKTLQGFGSLLRVIGGIDGGVHPIVLRAMAEAILRSVEDVQDHYRDATDHFEVAALRQG